MHATSLQVSIVMGLAALLGVASGAAAQPPAGPEGSPSRRFDATAYAAWFAANRGDLGGDTYRDWFSTPLGGAALGHYWTPHVKTEVELATTGEDRLTSGEYQSLGGGRSQSTFREHYYRSRTLDLLQSWQFLDNAWVHPFVGGGLHVVRESRRVEGRRQTYGGSPVGTPGITTEPLPTSSETVWGARVLVMTGFKAYFARHGFFRTDVRVALGSDVTDVMWRFGVGADF